ncbi:hypothetical protein CHU98_g10546 [Xylaria longipes]|nr:hypothetical protein CHU98_g10546 [Xylaria longipes]
MRPGPHPPSVIHSEHPNNTPFNNDRATHLTTRTTEITRQHNRADPKIQIIVYGCFEMATATTNFYELYRRSSIGGALTDTLDDLITQNNIDPQLAMKVLANFDRAIAEVLQEKVRSRLTFKASLDTYRFCDEVWTFQLKNVAFKMDNGGSTVQADRVKILLRFDLTREVVYDHQNTRNMGYTSLWARFFLNSGIKRHASGYFKGTRDMALRQASPFGKQAFGVSIYKG